MTTGRSKGRRCKGPEAGFLRMGAPGTGNKPLAFAARRVNWSLRGSGDTPLGPNQACRGGPVLCVQPDGIWYCNVTSENMDRIISQHLVGGQPVEDLVFHQGPGVERDV